MTADVVLVNRATAAKGIDGLFSTDGVSSVAGRAVLLPRGVLSDDTVEEATAAGALAVLVDGPLPAGAFSLDVPAGVPVVGLADGLVREIRALIAAGIPVTVAIGGVDIAEREGGGSIASFSSRGLAFDGGVKPDLAAPGVSVPTSEPGRGDEGEIRFGTVSGTSAAAAVTAGVAAILAEGRPGIGAVGLHGLLVGSAQRSRPRSDSFGCWSRRPSWSGAAGGVRRARGPLVRHGDGRTVRDRANRPRPQRLDSPSRDLDRERIAGVEGRRDHGRPGARPAAAGSERRGRGSRRHLQPVGRGRDCNGRARSASRRLTRGARTVGGRGTGDRGSDLASHDRAHGRTRVGCDTLGSRSRRGRGDGDA